MNALIIATACLLVFGACHEDDALTEPAPPINGSSNSGVKYPFKTAIEVESQHERDYALIVTMVPDSGTWYASPFSNNSYLGLLNIEVDQNDFFSLSGELTETPRSVAEPDPFSDETVNVVRERTTYEQSIQLTSQDDFEVAGMVSFVMEPICNRYEVGFTLVQQFGKLTVKTENPRVVNLPPNE